MSLPTASERQSFAEAALRLSGKTDEEARRTGAVDRADDQVEALFAVQYQTSHSPIHRAVWDKQTPLDLFGPPSLSPASCAPAMERCLTVVRSRRESGNLLDANGKVSAELLGEL